MSRVRDEAATERRARAVERRAATTSNSVWRGFVEYDLTREQKDALDVWLDKGSLWPALQEVVASGVVVSIKPDTRGKGFLAAFTQRTAGHVNEGLCVTARASHAGEALWRGVYKLVCLGLVTDWESAAGVADPDRW